MANSHENGSHEKAEFMAELKRRSDEMRASRSSTIAAGDKGEASLAEWKSNEMQVVHMPDDPQGIARVSIGGGHSTPINLDYCTIRGGVGECIMLLERAIAALKESPQ